MTVKTQTIHFNVAINYNVWDVSSPFAARACMHLRDAIQHGIKQHALDEPEHFHANTVEVDFNHVSCSVLDTALCILDEFNNINAAAIKAPIAGYLDSIQSDAGVSGLRDLASCLAPDIYRAWSDNSDFTSRLDVPFDLEFLPALLVAAHAKYGELYNISQPRWSELVLDVVHDLAPAPVEEEKAPLLQGLFVYNAQLYKTPFEAQAANALANVEGYEYTPVVGDLSVIMGSISKSLMFAGSAFTVVYIYGEQYLSDLGGVNSKLEVSECFTD